MDVNGRITEFILYKGLSVAEFERICGLSNGYVRKVKNSLGRRGLSDILRNFPDLNKDWLLTGEGEMLNPAYSNNKVTMNGNENVSNIGGQHISISLPEKGTQKIINPDGTVEVQSMGKGIDNFGNTDKFIELLKKKDEQIDRLITLLEKK